MIVNNQKSEQSKVISGVPQGSVLGPLLFLIMINDITKDNDSSISLFADDTRICRKISSEECVEKLQSDLEKLYSWQERNNMKFNGSKFEVIRYGNKSDLKEDTVYFTPNLEEIVEEKASLRDLGVILSSDMKFSNHVEKVTGTVNKKIGWILRTFRSRNIFMMKLLWKQLLQPHIDYCSQLYFQGQTKDLQKLENLQKVYTKKIREVNEMNYWERLNFLGLKSQERRIERYRIIYT